MLKGSWVIILKLIFPHLRKLLGLYGEILWRWWSQVFWWEWCATPKFMGCQLLSKNKNITIFYDKTLYVTHRGYLFSVRSSYVPVCCNKAIIVEPYSLLSFWEAIWFLLEHPLSFQGRFFAPDPLITCWDFLAKYLVKTCFDYFQSDFFN